MTPEPLLAIFLPLEGGVVVREFTHCHEDIRRLLVDLDSRDDLVGEIEAAIERALEALRFLYGQEAA